MNFAGVVVDTGRNGHDIHGGARVVCETAAWIQPNSKWTLSGLYNLDPERRGFGYSVNGAMTRFISVPQRCLHVIADHVTMDQAALVEPCCVAYNATVNNSNIRPGDHVVVLGPGPIGILCGIMAQLQGAEVAIAGLERDHARLETARQYGMVLLEDRVDAWTRDSYGVDAVIDATGVSSSLATALRLVRPAGWITKVGWGPDPMRLFA